MLKKQQHILCNVSRARHECGAIFIIVIITSLKTYMSSS